MEFQKKYSDEFIYPQNEIDVRLSLLDKEIEELSKRIEILNKITKSRRHKVLISEIAVTLDKIASQFVDTGFNNTIEEIKSMASDGELDSEQLIRWEKFCSFLKSHNWSMGEINAYSRIIKDLGYGYSYEYVSAEEKKQVTLEDLIKWINEESSLPSRCCEFTILVSRFCKNNCPLVPVIDINSIVNNI